MSTLLDDRYTFLLGLAVYYLEWENSGTNLWRKSNHIFWINKFLMKSCVLCDNVEDNETDRLQRAVHVG